MGLRVGVGGQAELEIEWQPAEGAARLGESPFWDHHDAIWWVDIDGKRLLRTALSSRRTEGWPTPEIPGFVVLVAPERPVVGMERGLYAFSPADGRFERLLTRDRPGQRFNDATVDAIGRLWVSTMALDAAAGAGAVHQVTADLRLRTVVDGITTPNGLAADHRDGRLFLSDSHPRSQMIWTMECDFETGACGARAPFAAMTGLAGRPDGAALGSGAAAYLIAAVDGAVLYGFTARGQIALTVPLPFPAPTKPAFFAGGVAVTAKAEGGYDGALALAFGPPAALSGPAVPFWRAGER